jgi:hypothetical protein
MQRCPLQYQNQRPSWQRASYDLKRPDIDKGLEFSIKGVKVGRRMLLPEHLNQNAVECAYGGQRSLLLRLETGDALRFEDLDIIGISQVTKSSLPKASLPGSD